MGQFVGKWQKQQFIPVTHCHQAYNSVTTNAHIHIQGVAKNVPQKILHFLRKYLTFIGLQTTNLVHGWSTSWTCVVTSKLKVYVLQTRYMDGVWWPTSPTCMVTSDLQALDGCSSHHYCGSPTSGHTACYRIWQNSVKICKINAS